MNEHPRSAPESSLEHIQRRFWQMYEQSRTHPASTAAERKALLRGLRSVLADHGGDFADTIARDFGWRSHDETRMAEVVPALTLVGDALRNLHQWMRTETRATSMFFWPARNSVVWQPKGVVLIISPWNYPLLLAVGALTAAFAAGNRVIIKPSEAAPSTAATLKRSLEGALGPDRVTVALGGAEVAQSLCALPFDHIFFTGSTAVGRLVMQAAAENLTPVTLELGGKSPAIVHPAFNHRVAAERIVRGKLLNAGQTCIAPDYALVQRQKVDEFVRLFEDTASRFYPRFLDNPDYTSVISQQHYDRLVNVVEDARAKGARVVSVDPAGELTSNEIGSRSTRKIAPAVVTDVADDMTIMQEELFGPVLPVVAYDSLEDALAYVNGRPRPLALYYFDDDRKRVKHVMQRTVSGGASINDTVLQFAQEGLPFGGIGASGMGVYHGRDGFRTFSHGKGVFSQSRWSFTDLLVPPYGQRFRRLIRFAMWRSGA